MIVGPDWVRFYHTNLSPVAAMSYRVQGFLTRMDTGQEYTLGVEVTSTSWWGKRAAIYFLLWFGGYL